MARVSRFPVPLRGRLGERGQARRDPGAVARRPDPRQTRHLLLAHPVVVHLEDVDRIFLAEPVLVDADDDVGARVDARLLLRRARLDLQLGPAAGDRLRHAAHRVDLVEDGLRLLGHLLRERLHHVAAGPGVDDAGDVRLLLQDELGVARDAGRELGGQRDRLVEAVGVQALGAAEHGGHRLDGGAHDVVVRILLGQAPARGLAVRAQHQALRVLRAEALHDPAPQQARRAHLGDLEVEVHPDRPEEREPPRELVDVQPARERRLHVLLAVGERERELQRLVRPGLLHVVAGDRDRVELRHVPRRVLDDVADDPHRGLGRIDVRVPDHELLEDVVLDGAGELVLRNALLLARDDVAREHRQHAAVHGHRDGDLVERDAVEEDLHVLDRVDRHARLADVAEDARMVAVVAAVGGEVEGDAHALPAGFQPLAIEGVRVLGGGEARVLADGPGPARVHRGLRAADEGREARQRVGEFGLRQRRDVGRGVQRLDDQALRRRPVQRGQVAAGRGLRRGLAPLLERDPGEFVRGWAHGVLEASVGPDGRASGSGVDECV